MGCSLGLRNRLRTLLVHFRVLVRGGGSQTVLSGLEPSVFGGVDCRLCYVSGRGGGVAAEQLFCGPESCVPMVLAGGRSLLHTWLQRALTVQRH